MEKDNILAIVGPTASGKTGLSIELAKRYSGEVISADSRQVYRELNIGTEKVTKKEMQGVPHYCIDIASPRRSFSVEQWRRHAVQAIKTIQQHNHLPIIAGGTGFYVDSLIYNHSFPSVKPNVNLRNKLKTKTTEELFATLKQLDPQRARTVEQKNPRRLIRAIEIATTLGKVPEIHKKQSDFTTLWIGIFPGLTTLEERIQNRFDSTICRGLVAETKRLREELGLSWSRINELGLEYRIVAQYIRKEITKEEMREKNFRELRRYAKRQMTWLKRNTEIQWYNSKEEVLTDPNLAKQLNEYSN